MMLFLLTNIFIHIFRSQFYDPIARLQLCLIIIGKLFYICTFLAIKLLFRCSNHGERSLFWLFILKRAKWGGIRSLNRSIEKRSNDIKNRSEKYEDFYGTNSYFAKLILDKREGGGKFINLEVKGWGNFFYEWGNFYS